MGFFNDLGKKATEAYKTTSDKTNKIAREMKLKSYINENKNRINEVYTEIGKKVYEKFNEGNLSDVENLIKPELDRINEYAKKIENMNNELRVINNIKLCKICTAEIDLNARFCPKCGAVQKEEVKPENAIAPTQTAVNPEPIQSVQTPEETNLNTSVPESTSVEEPVVLNGEEPTVETSNAEAPVESTAEIIEPIAENIESSAQNIETIEENMEPIVENNLEEKSNETTVDSNEENNEEDNV